MEKYLYGASVQGIQSFIFETNKLKEIVGASELVEQICTKEFKNQIENKKIKFDEDAKLIMAAGNIKYIFETKEDCQIVVYDFAKNVMEKASGITISQAVVELKSENPTQDDINKLEERLKIQRNKATRQHGLGWMISERSRSTGNAAVKWDKKALDKAQVQKEKMNQSAKNSLMKKLIGEYKITNNNFPFDIGDVVEKEENEWLAVIHADGNSLGKLIQKMVESIEQNKKDVKKGFAEFSDQLDKATTQAANDAFEKIIKPDYEALVLKNKNSKQKLPIRPVVIGGDDLTIIIRGDLAVDFTTEFLNAFQKRTAENFSNLVNEYDLTEFKNGLTACAGIAYIKPSFPFHFAINLAEELCAYSKKAAKKVNKTNVPACFMFHKVQSSFVDNYKSIIKRELTAGNIQFNVGPYAINDSCAKLRKVSILKKQAREIKRSDSPKSQLRNWLSELSINNESANQLMERIKTITGDHFVSDLNLNNAIQNQKTHIYDILSLASIEK